MPRFVITIAGRVVTSIEEAGESTDEDLGLEWALSELRDSFRHDGRVDGQYSLADAAEVADFLGVLRGLLGDAALGGHADRVAG